MLPNTIKISFFLILILISGTVEISACPSASIVHGWSCVDDVECPDWQSCDLWSHMCLTKGGYCGYDLVCKNSWEECGNETHKCFPMQGYCNNDSDCESGQKCIKNQCKLNEGNSTNNGSNSTNNDGGSLKDYLNDNITSPPIIAGLIILLGIIISVYINKKFA
jgi:hypothetical protein